MGRRRGVRERKSNNKVMNPLGVECVAGSTST